MSDSDNRPSIIKFVEKVNRVIDSPSGSGMPGLDRHATAPAEHRLPAVDGHDRTRIESAARYALSTHPGPVGELIHRELQAFLEFGYRFDDGGLTARIVDHVMATAPQDASPSR